MSVAMSTSSAPQGTDPSASLIVAARRVLSVVCFGAVPAVLTIGMIAVSSGTATFSYDFHGGLYNAGHDILVGHSPYRPAYLAMEAALKRAGGTPPYIDVPVYPPAVLIAVTPLALLPFKVAATLFAAISIAAVVAALRLLDVRDWRCYGLAFASWPLVDSVRLGALSPLLVLGLAASWRLRDKLVGPAVATAAIIAAKLFPWTVAVWLLVTRRLRALALMTALLGLGILAAWAAIGFDGLTSYPRMLSDLAFIQQAIGVSVVSTATSLGTSLTVAKLATLMLTVAVLWSTWRLARKPGGDSRAFGMAVMASLVASTNVWPHYLVVVFVPIALMSRTLSPIWFVPLLAYLAPTNQTLGSPMLTLPYVAIEAIVIARLLSPRLFAHAPGISRAPAQAADDAT